jgi:anti-sigma B factor antagonist
MWNTQLQVESRAHDDQTWVFSLKGSLFGSTDAYAFQQQVRDRIGEGASKVVIDLSGVDKIDSSGIGILVAVMWSASRAGGGMVLASIPPKVEKILEIAMLLDHIDHADSVDAALELLQRMKLSED